MTKQIPPLPFLIETSQGFPTALRINSRLFYGGLMLGPQPPLQALITDVPPSTCPAPATVAAFPRLQHIRLFLNSLCICSALFLDYISLCSSWGSLFLLLSGLCSDVTSRGRPLESSYLKKCPQLRYLAYSFKALITI